MSDLIVQGQCIEGSTVVLLARITDAMGDYPEQTDLSSITVNVYNADSGDLLSSPTADVTDCLSDTIVDDDSVRWTVDAVGYNLAITIAGEDFAGDEGPVYQVEVKIEPVSGSHYWLHPFRLDVTPLFSEPSGS